jgi:hypothetical protein
VHIRLTPCVFATRLTLLGISIAKPLAVAMPSAKHRVAVFINGEALPPVQDQMPAKDVIDAIACHCGGGINDHNRHAIFSEARKWIVFESTSARRGEYRAELERHENVEMAAFRERSPPPTDEMLKRAADSRLNAAVLADLDESDLEVQTHYYLLLAFHRATSSVKDLIQQLRRANHLVTLITSGEPVPRDVREILSFPPIPLMTDGVAWDPRAGFSLSAPLPPEHLEFIKLQRLVEARERCTRRQIEVVAVRLVRHTDDEKEEIFWRLHHNAIEAPRHNPRLRVDPPTLPDATKALCVLDEARWEEDCAVLGFHCTPQDDVIDHICRDGVRVLPRATCSKFGVGPYFALEPSYAARYALSGLTAEEAGVRPHVFTCIAFYLSTCQTYPITLTHDYRDPATNEVSDTHPEFGHSKFFSDGAHATGGALARGYDSHVAPVRAAGYIHPYDRRTASPRDLQYQAASETSMDHPPEAHEVVVGRYQQCLAHAVLTLKLFPLTKSEAQTRPQQMRVSQDDDTAAEAGEASPAPSALNESANIADFFSPMLCEAPPVTGLTQLRRHPTLGCVYLPPQNPNNHVKIFSASATVTVELFTSRILRHDFIVGVEKIFIVGANNAARVCGCSEEVPGVPLGDVVGCLCMADCERVLRCVAEALAFGHRFGIVHGRVNFDSISVTTKRKGGVVGKLGDWTLPAVNYAALSARVDAVDFVTFVLRDKRWPKELQRMFKSRGTLRSDAFWRAIVWHLPEINEADFHYDDSAPALNREEILESQSLNDMQPVRAVELYDGSPVQVVDRHEHRHPTDAAPSRESSTTTKLTAADEVDSRAKSQTDAGESLNAQGLVAYNLGGTANLFTAMSLFDRALDVREKTFGPNSTQVFQTLHNKALVFRSLGGESNLAAALELHDRVVVIGISALGADHPRVATAIIGKADTLRIIGGKEYLTAAVEFYDRAVTILTKAFGGEHSRVADALNNLGLALLALGGTANLFTAMSLFDRALDVREKTFGPNSTQVSQTLHNKASVLQSLGGASNLAAALELHDRVIVIGTSALGADHPRVATAIIGKADTLRIIGGKEYLTAAIEFYDRAVTMLTKAFGGEHSRVAAALNNLGLALLALGGAANLVSAMSLFDRALDVREKTFGPNSTQVSQTLHNKALVFRSLGGESNLAAALELHDRVIVIGTSALGADHPRVATAIIGKADTLRIIGGKEYLTAAVEFYDRAVTILTKAFGGEHSRVVAALTNKGVTLQALLAA